MSPEQQLPQLRVAVNSRCGRACFYCRPSGEAVATDAGVELDPDDLVFFIDVASKLGLIDIKLTGGDPALYEPLASVVGRLHHVTDVRTIEVISRHPRIGDIADDLHAAGVDLFNVSIDAVDADLHKAVTGVGDFLELVWALDRLVATGTPVKVNSVVMRGINDTRIEELISFCESHGVTTLKLLDVIDDLDAGAEFNTVRLIAKTEVDELRDLYQPLDDIATMLGSRAVREETLRQGDLGHPMKVFTMASGLGVVVKDAAAGAWYGSICEACAYYPCHDALMALRLTADLRLQFCLLREDVTMDVSGAVHDRDEVQLRAALVHALSVYGGAEFVTPGVQRVSVRGLA